ncbi:ATP-binding cassette domain-containing protein [Psychrobacter sp.]|uniref:ATP-binding cassette domain-containing protein n=1 Tax=Psychrobacter sp. TaxID=56811 RepID=UPI0025FFB8D9|nr:ATP-binding cassette domain-containing protein [Psychrobacter sp.]
MTHICLENVSKIFGANHVESNKVLSLLEQGMSSNQVLQSTGYSVGLYNINLAIKAGELHCIMGLSGSGKSTLIRHINRLIDPTLGKIWIDTQHSEGMPEYLNSAERAADQPNVINVLSLSDKPLQQFRQNNVSMVFQHFGLVPHMTVIQNVAYGLRVRKLSKSERHEIAHHWLHEVGLENIDNSYPDELSGGMQQRVGLARALAVDTSILLMDEAFSALDPLIRSQLQDQLLKLQEKLNKTIVFITHDIDEAVKLGNRISILNGGRLVQTGTSQQLQEHPADDYVEQFMLARH